MAIEGILRMGDIGCELVSAHGDEFPEGDFLGSRSETFALNDSGAVQMRCMREDDLPSVLTIEHRSFPDPWSALAFVSEIRYNPQSRYMVACDIFGRVCGYIGLSLQIDTVWVTRIAVDAQYRRQGIASAMIQLACGLVDLSGYDGLALEVRTGNVGARAFYQSMDFQEIDLWNGYYNNPPEDAAVLVRVLDM